MRTTLDIDPDVLAAAKEISARTHATAGQVISGLARKALTAARPFPESNRGELNGFEILPSEGRVVTPDMVRKLLEESEGR